MITALLHGLGVGLYAFLSIIGLAALITASPLAFDTLQWGGALYLGWLGIKGLTARPRAAGDPAAAATAASAARDGFLVVFLNPKVAVFFIALFSQVVGAETSLLAKLGYAATAMVIDGGWYLLVALVLSHPAWLARLNRYGVWLDRLFGLVLLLLAARLLVTVITG